MPFFSCLFSGYRFASGILLAVLILGSIPGRADTFLFATAADGKRVQPIVQLIRAAYQSLGHDIKVDYLPAKRALLHAQNDTRYDGELLRIADAQALLTNLSPVPEPIFEARLFMLSHTIDTPLPSVASLQHYKLAAIRGIIYTDQKLSGFDVEYVTDLRQGIDLLNLKRIDLFMIPGFFARELQAVYPNLHMVESPYEPVDVFHYVHNRHRQLIPELTEAIRQAKRGKSALETH